MNPARDPGGIQAALNVMDDVGQELVHVRNLEMHRQLVLVTPREQEQVVGNPVEARRFFGGGSHGCNELFVPAAGSLREL